MMRGKTNSQIFWKLFLIGLYLGVMLSILYFHFNYEIPSEIHVSDWCTLSFELGLELLLQFSLLLPFNMVELNLVLNDSL